MFVCYECRKFNMARPSQRIITFYSLSFKIQPKIKLLSSHRVQRNFFLHLILNELKDLFYVNLILAQVSTKEIHVL